MPIRPENRHRYPADWAEIRERMLHRATRWVEGVGMVPRCECRGECGRGTHEGQCPNFNGGEAYGTGSRVVLTIAHLDHTPENNHGSNLRAMCQGCHLHYDLEHHAETRARTLREAREASGQTQLAL